MNEVDKYLTHHGILGQKWGKQNGPPYPLNPANRSSVEKKKNGSNHTESGLAAYKNASLGLKNGLKGIKKQSASGSNNASKGGGGAAAKSLKTTAPEGWIKGYRADMDEILASNPDFSFGSMEEFTAYLSKNGVDVGSLSDDVLKGMYKTATDALNAYKVLHKSDAKESKTGGKGSGGSSGKGSAKEEKKEEQEEKAKEYEKIDSAEWKEKRTKLADDFYSKFDEIKSKTEFPNNINEFIKMLKDFELYKEEAEDGFPTLSEEQLDDLWKEVIRLIEEKHAFEKEDKEDKEENTLEDKKELQHHGILGQKWGKQNGPPYPLNPANRSSAEKRQNGSKYTKSGLETYGKNTAVIGGGGGGNNDEEDKEKEELIKRIAEMTGMKESEIRSLLALRENADGNNDKYLSVLKSISKGDPQMAKRIDNAISSYVKNTDKNERLLAQKKLALEQQAAQKLSKSITDKQNKINERVKNIWSYHEANPKPSASNYGNREELYNRMSQIDSAWSKQALQQIMKENSNYQQIINEYMDSLSKNSGVSKSKLASNNSDKKPISREQNVIEGTANMERQGEGLGTGPVGNRKEEEEKKKKLHHSSKYELYHHGILGQKWGKRNGPPYPLSRNPFKRAAIYGSKKINSGLEKISRIPQHMLEKPAAKWKDRGDKYATRKKVAEEYLNGKRSDNPKPTNNAENTYLQINDSNTGKTFTKPISSMTSNELRSAIEHIKLQNELVSLLNGNSSSSNSNNYNSPPISTGREYLNDLNRDIGSYVKVGTDIVRLVNNMYDMRQKFRGKGDSKTKKALEDIDKITEAFKEG